MVTSLCDQHAAGLRDLNFGFILTSTRIYFRRVWAEAGCRRLVWIAVGWCVVWAGVIWRGLTRAVAGNGPVCAVRPGVRWCGLPWPGWGDAGAR